MVYYFGAFPPPYGGVTVKNELLFSELHKICGDKLIKLDTQQAKKNPIIMVFQGLMLLLNRKNPILVATAAKQRRKITIFLNRFNRHVLEKSCLIVMGGHFAERIKGDDAYINALSRYGCIYLETQRMVQDMQELGLQNVKIYPNCRKRPAEKLETGSRGEMPLRCVFFSLISLDKGADIALEAAKQIPGVQFDFYGVLEQSYREQFLQEIKSISNAVYHGVFQVKGENVYCKLNEYDALLFPTSWPHEGVPGVLVEAKIAGVPAIVSNVCYNSEIVEDGVSGIVMKENTAGELIKAIRQLDTNRDLLCKLKNGAQASSERYFVDNYLEDIVRHLKEQRRM